MLRRTLGGVVVAGWFAVVCSASAQLPEYTLFEAGQVRPVAMSPDGTRLFAVNTPNATLEIFDVGEDALSFAAQVPVGLEPVAVAARDDGEVWVVNHLSDSVSIVDVASVPPRVVRTLLVGDEPRDIVFAGSAGTRAFIAMAHRGQSTPYPRGDFDVPSVGRADVWVFEADDLGTSLGGTPLTRLVLFGDRPRALAATPDGSTVYAAVFRSGNQTTTVGEGQVCNTPGPCTLVGNDYPGGLPEPRTNFEGIPSRQAGLVVGINPETGNWEDELGRDWNNAVRFDLPDHDVFEIDADAPVPVETNRIAGVGTVLFNMLVNPVTGDLFVTNTEARNRIRFEGMAGWVGELGPKPSGEPPSVRGHLHEARVTIVDSSKLVTARHLNKHIDYAAQPQPAGTKDRSLATPLGMAISSDGATLYIAGFGSSAVATYDVSALRDDSFVPDATNMIPLPHGGPSGIVLDEARGRLYVMTRFDNRIVVLDTSTRGVLQTVALENPEPVSIIDGRRFLYDAKRTGSNGEASCASCHVFGDMDDLAWDLGDPDLSPVPNPNPCAIESGAVCGLQNFDPLKGPMTTQSLRGMVHAGPMHWRGDRTGGSTGGDALDSEAAFNAFNVAFPGLVGRDEGELPAVDMQAFTDFALRLTYPPNPIRRLDNVLRVDEQAGLDMYIGPITDVVSDCNGCHELDRASGFFGTNGGSTFESLSMEFKVPHLRNIYQKVGMFGMRPSDFVSDIDQSFMGDQVRGFGFLHDGSISTAFNFLSGNVFSLSELQRSNLQALLMAFESDLAPIVGQQITLTDDSPSEREARVDLLIERSGTPFEVPLQGGATECDLVVSGVIDGKALRWLRRGDGTFVSDADPDMPISEADLRAHAEVPGQPLTFTCVPPGSGPRMAGITGAGGSGGSGGVGGVGGTGGSAGVGGESGSGGSQPPDGENGGGCSCQVTNPRSELPMSFLLAVFCLLAMRRISRGRLRPLARKRQVE
jgi:YVTN family beta-propeller protein